MQESTGIETLFPHKHWITAEAREKRSGKSARDPQLLRDTGTAWGVSSGRFPLTRTPQLLRGTDLLKSSMTAGWMADVTEEAGRAFTQSARVPSQNSMCHSTFTHVCFPASIHQYKNKQTPNIIIKVFVRYGALTLKINQIRTVPILVGQKRL